MPLQLGTFLTAKLKELFMLLL